MRPTHSCAGIGSATDLDDRVASDLIFSRASRYDTAFVTRGTLLVILVLLAMVAAAAAVLHARLRPSFEETWWAQALEPNGLML